MGQKGNPVGYRLGFIKTWNSQWFDERNFADKLNEDLLLRRYIYRRMADGAVSRIDIERTARRILITIRTARPGVVIGKKGAEVDKLKEELKKLVHKDIQINIDEIKHPEMDALLVAQNIARQLEGKVSFRRAMKRALTSSMRLGAEGIKIVCSGRLGGAEMARTESYKEGRIPLHTLRADIDYALHTAQTTYGSIGVKVWIYHGEVIGAKS
ncbi:30S ribosomal protein S3 [Candidatus Saccharibacteria bacterium]|nr:30S ribosomal protein S3 [Candidatus Saccharibacteria bacterium]NIV03727.1 30S ribosomal protein S3 [Calditrichia bacterium]NIV72028.1 30S ribosomal protein S3 [Calditrichia bacterium]NIV98861.1 30S ribosomal protein S3 [Candidatus Saccharibacteria bacterium]NIW79138.1 30S ribosomal protein S3 [Calditrichia bacterium]